jgi:soluble P-type ATPase
MQLICVSICFIVAELEVNEQKTKEMRARGTKNKPIILSDVNRVDKCLYLGSGANEVVAARINSAHFALHQIKGSNVKFALLYGY